MFKQLQQRKRQEGFTIIEVLIVLAIAGLIMVVVFLAVPALQRSQRNNQTKTEANNILSAYSNAVSNNGGSNLTASVSTTAGSDAAGVLQDSNAKTITTLTIQTSSTVTAPATNPTTQAFIVPQYKCTAQNSITLASGTPRQAALIYWVETTGSQQVQCLNV
jgi:type IV pilus assembly protein PilA